jgi:hypothetical protein
MSRSTRRSPRRDDSDPSAFYFSEEAGRASWGHPAILVALLIGGLVLLWAMAAGYGLWVLIIASGSLGLLLLIGLVSAVRVVLAWSSHQVTRWRLWTEARAHRLAEARAAMVERQASAEADQRRAQAEHLKALATYVKAEAEAEQLRTSAQRNRAAMQAGLHYPGTHGYPIYLSEDLHRPAPRIVPTDYRAGQVPRGDQPPAAVSAPQAPTLLGPLPLPQPARDLDILRHWDWRPDNIYLATGRGGQHFTCSLEGWGHIAHDARTGGGKTLLARLELAMMLILGVDVVLCNPHFAPIDKRGHDWRPIGFHLEQQGVMEIAPGIRVGRIVRKAEAIARLLEYLARTELDRRYDLQARGSFAWRPLYVFVDEVPWLTAVAPAIAGHLITLLQRGRAVDVRLLTNAQSFLVNATRLKGGNGGRFDTAHFLGGNPKSGAVMLDLGERDLKDLIARVQAEANQALGRGLGLLRNQERVPQTQPVRVPFGTNEFQYYLLGRHDDWQLPEFRQGMRPAATASTPPAAEAPHPYWTWDDAAKMFYRPGSDARVVDADADDGTTPRLLVSRAQPLSGYGQTQPAEPLYAATGEALEDDRLSEREIPSFLAAYTICGNIDQALATLGRGARYRQHASELLQNNHLHRKA